MSRSSRASRGSCPLRYTRNRDKVPMSVEGRVGTGSDAEEGKYRGVSRQLPYKWKQLHANRQRNTPTRVGFLWPSRTPSANKIKKYITLESLVTQRRLYVVAARRGHGCPFSPTTTRSASSVYFLPSGYICPVANTPVKVVGHKVSITSL